VLPEPTRFVLLVTVLGESGRDRDWFVFAGVHPNPIEDDVRQPAEIIRKAGCDGVIAIGGGSPLDAGKAARLLAKRPGLISPSFIPSRRIGAG
jgi:alcohol dehydrogenase class IV